MDNNEVVTEEVAAVVENNTGIEIEPLFEEQVDFDTFSKSDFRVVKVKNCEAVPKSKKLLRFTLDDGTENERTIDVYKRQCVLCGHNGSRYGTFFTPLNQISIGDEVMITDKKGLKHIYEVTETEVVNPYDNSIKTQGTEKELTLFTCSQKGTMRFVVRCIYKEAVMDE